VGVVLEIVQNIEDLQFLIIRFGHGKILLMDLVHYITPNAGRKVPFARSTGHGAPFAFVFSL
jgi:hypothetical protein